MANPPIFPWECRDVEDLAKAHYNQPLRRVNQSLEEENSRLKKLLREHGIAWSPVAQNHLKQGGSSSFQRKTRSSTSAAERGGTRLPMEVMLRILDFAMQSPESIVDPLSPSTPETLTDKEKTRGNQIAIHFLATSRAFHVEGTRILWTKNQFVFTSPQAVRNFAELSAEFRHKITHVSFRVIARYYDDQKRRHKLDRCYHPDLKKDQLLKVAMRPKDSPLVRGGFRCYTWNQVVDFLSALRAPYDPTYKQKSTPRPRLLPSLVSLRLDLVNFSDTLLPFSGVELHDITSHELGCTLNELQVTGMPFDDAGIKASAELSGLLKDEGLYLDAAAAFMAKSKTLQPMGGSKWCARVLRAWKGHEHDDEMDVDSDEEDHMYPYTGNHPRLGALPPAPSEAGHPISTRDPETVIWKRIPSARDSLTDRHWVQFSRYSGYEIPEPDVDSDDEGICPCCGEYHPGASFLSFLEEELDDD